MKRLLIVIQFLFVGFSGQALAETWSCSYTHAGDVKTAVWVREGNGFYNVYSKTTNYIINENQDFIHLYNQIEGFTTYFATTLSKHNSMFSMVALDPPENSDIIYGDCLVY